MAQSIDPNQGLLVISCCQSTKPLYLIKKIKSSLNQWPNDSKDLNVKEDNYGSDQSISCYDLHIDNKYYSTDVYLFDMKTKNIISQQFADCVHGVVVYIDNNQESSFDVLKSWLPFLDQYNCQIKLLVCQTVTDHSVVSTQIIQKWCIDNEFELIELNPRVSDDEYDDEDDDEDDDQFKELYGVQRISQALQAYSWPFITLKDTPQYTPSLKFKNLIDKEIYNSINSNPSEQIDCPNQSESPDHCSTPPNTTDPSLIQDDDLENFEHLFTKFSQMKVKASQLNDSDRKVYAEKVTMAFWKAIKGDQQEVEGVDQTQEIL